MRGRQARRIDLGVHRCLSRVHELIGLWLPGQRWPDRQITLYGLQAVRANQLRPSQMCHIWQNRLFNRESGGVNEVGVALFEIRHHCLNLIGATNQRANDPALFSELLSSPRREHSVK